MFDLDVVETPTADCTPASACEPRVADLPYEVLLESFWPTIGAMATKYPSRYRDELLQSARIALWQAQEDYQDDRGASFRTYALLRIGGAMKDTLRGIDPLSQYVRRKTRVVRAPLDDALDVPAELGVEGAHRLFEQFPRAMARLDPELRLFLLEEIFGGVSCQSVAEQLNLTISRVSQRRREAREALIKALGVDSP